MRLPAQLLQQSLQFAGMIATNSLPSGVGNVVYHDSSSGTGKALRCAVHSMRIIDALKGVVQQSIARILPGCGGIRMDGNRQRFS